MAGTIGRRDLGEITAALGGAALLTASWVVVVTRDDVPALEVRAFVAANGLPDALWPLVWAPVQAGSLVGSLVIVAATAAVTRRKRLTVARCSPGQGAYWAAKGVKHLAARERPRQLLPVVEVRERATGLGYVSGHSAVAFALATVLALGPPRRVAHRAVRGSRPAWASAACTRARTCRSTSSAASAWVSSPGRGPVGAQRRWRRRPRTTR